MLASSSGANAPSIAAVVVAYDPLCSRGLTQRNPTYFLSFGQACYRYALTAHVHWQTRSLQRSASTRLVEGTASWYHRGRIGLWLARTVRAATGLSAHPYKRFCPSTFSFHKPPECTAKRTLCDVFTKFKRLNSPPIQQRFFKCSQEAQRNEELGWVKADGQCKKGESWARYSMGCAYLTGVSVPLLVINWKNWDVIIVVVVIWISICHSTAPRTSPILRRNVKSHLFRVQTARNFSNSYYIICNYLCFIFIS